MPSRLIFLPIESYKSRYSQYTSVADGVYETCFKQLGINFKAIRPSNELKTIKQGQVLDVQQRLNWCQAQISELVRMICEDEIDPQEDVIYLEDFFTFSFEAIPYAQSSKFGSWSQDHAKVFSFCHAQSFDINDFTAAWKWWLRPLEQMWFDYQEGVFCAARQMLPLIAGAGISLTKGSRYKVHPVGHAVNKDSMLRIADAEFAIPWEDRPKNVVYSSRWDLEKNPNFFMDLIEAVLKERDDITFTVCSGHTKLSSNDPDLIFRLESIVLKYPGKVWVLDNINLNRYYSELKNSRVLFNCALQDWISYVLIDATINGCAPLFPNWLSFPDALERNTKHLYANMNLEDAKQKLYVLIDSNKAIDVDWVYDKYESTVKRMVQTMGFKLNG